MRERVRMSARQISEPFLFQVEQIFFYLQSSGKTGQAAGASYHPMAGNDNGQGILISCPAHGPGLVYIAERGCNLAVGSGFAIGDFLYTGPDLLLKGGALRIQRQIKARSLVLKIFINPGLDPTEQAMIIRG